MKNIEFSKKYGYVANHDGIIKLKLHPYQEMILNNLDEERLPKTIIDSSRQTGVSTSLALHIANFLIFHQGKKSAILIKSVTMDSANHLLNKVKVILRNYYQVDPYLKNNKYELQLENGNSVEIISTTMSFCGLDVSKYHTLIVDNAKFVNKLDEFLQEIYSYPSMNLVKTVLASTDGVDPNFPKISKTKLENNLNGLVKAEKPPLGLIPREIWIESTFNERYEEVKQAIKRYIDTGKEVPNEWLQELIEFNKVIKDI